MKTQAHKMVKIITLTTAVSALSLASIAPVSAFERGERGYAVERGEFKSERHVAKKQKRIERMTKVLNLTEDQVALLQASQAPNTDNREEVRTLREELRNLTQSSDYSERDAKKIIDQITDLTEDNMLEKANAKNAFYISLSEEQLATLETMANKRQQRHK